MTKINVDIFHNKQADPTLDDANGPPPTGAILAGDYNAQHQLDPATVTAALVPFSSSVQGVVPHSDGNVAHFLRADGTWAAPAGGGGGGGITNGAGANVVPKSDGTNLIASRITDDGATITIPGVAAIGSVNSQSLINGPTWQSFAIPSTSYAFGEINRMEISGVVPAWPADTFTLVIRNSCTADCTTHTQRSGAGAFEVTGSRTAGANDLFNVAFESLATGAQDNIAFEALAGDVNIDAGNLSVTGTGFFTGFLATTGVLFAEGNGAQGLFLSGTPTNNIYSTDANTVFNVHNAAAATLEVTNDGGGTITLVVDGDLRVGSAAAPRILSGVGSPAGVVAAPVGSLYLRTDGGSGSTLYVKETGTTTSAGWVAK